MQAPLIDNRSYADLVAQTEQLAEQFSGWQPRARRAAGRRPGADPHLRPLRRAGDRAPQPRAGQELPGLPEPHRRLAASAAAGPRAADLPAWPRTARSTPWSRQAPWSRRRRRTGSPDDVVFETERSWSSPAPSCRPPTSATPDRHLQRPHRRRPRAWPTSRSPSSTGDQPSPHQLYLACDPLLTQPGRKDVTLTLASPDTWQWAELADQLGVLGRRQWQHGDQQRRRSGGCLARDPVRAARAGPVRDQRDRGRLAAGTARAAASAGRDRAAAGVDRDRRQEPAGPDPPAGPVSRRQLRPRFYLSADDAFAAGGARRDLRSSLSQPGADRRRCAAPLVSIRRTARWLPLGQSSAAARADGRHRLRASRRHPGLHPGRRDQLPRAHVVAVDSLYRTRTGRWLRVDVAGGPVRHPARDRRAHRGLRLGAAAAGRHHRRRPAGPARGPVPSPAAFCNCQPDRPEQGLLPAGPAAAIQRHLLRRLPGRAGPARRGRHPQRDPDQPAGIVGDPVAAVGPRPRQSRRSPGRCPTGASGTRRAASYAFTGRRPGEHHPARSHRAPAVVNGEPGYWVRARLVGGKLRNAAGYRRTQSGGSYSVSPPRLRAPGHQGAVTVTATARAAAAGSRSRPA